jgi:hypothetical protein
MWKRKPVCRKLSLAVDLFAPFFVEEKAWRKNSHNSDKSHVKKVE